MRSRLLKVAKAILVFVIIFSCVEPAYALGKKSKASSSGSSVTFKERCRNWQKKWVNGPHKKHTDSSSLTISSSKTVK